MHLSHLEQLAKVIIIDDKKYGTVNLIKWKTEDVTISQQFLNWKIVETEGVEASIPKVYI
jgi:hypothetical protein